MVVVVVGRVRGGFSRPKGKVSLLRVHGVTREQQGDSVSQHTSTSVKRLTTFYLTIPEIGSPAACFVRPSSQRDILPEFDLYGLFYS